MLSFRTIDLSRDQETITRFRRDSYVVSFGDSSLFGEERDYIQRIAGRLEKFPGGLVIAEKDGNAVGQIEMQIKSDEDGNIGYVNLFYLMEDYRGKGYGNQLLDYAEQFFRQNNLKSYQLRVSPTNTRAIRFYEKNGFTLLRAEEKNGTPRLRMKKELKRNGGEL